MTHSDVIVVGGGIVGLGHAVEAVRRGLSVTVIEREDQVVGASIRNFGHGGLTVQTGRALRHAKASRVRWLELARTAGFWVGETGTVVVARAADELEVLHQLHAARDGAGVVLLDADQTAARSTAAGVTGGAWLPNDIRVDPREAAPAIARWLATQPGVTLQWSTHAVGLEPGRVLTTRGVHTADQVVVCVGHDVDRLLPDVAERHGVRRCRLHMLRVAAPGGRTIAPAVLTGLSMLRYPAMAALPAVAAVRERIAAQRPELLELGVNLMLTQRPDGDLQIGDTHEYAHTHQPFAAEAVDDLLLAETAALLGVDRLDVRERWRGVYASARDEFLVEQPMPGTAVVSVTSGIGMTTGLGLAAHVLGEMLEGRVPDAG